MSTQKNQDKIIDNRKINFFRVENSIIDRTDIDIYESMLYITLCRYADNRSESCFPSYDKLAKKAKMSKRKAIYAMKSLIEKKLVKKMVRYTHAGEQTSNLYYVLSADVPLDEECTRRTPPVHTAHPPSAHGAPYKDLSKKTNIKNNFSLPQHQNFEQREFDVEDEDMYFENMKEV